MLNPDHPIAGLRSAPYNPREIEDDAREALADSIRRFGMLRPLIARDDTGTLIAGHQRLTALKALGFETAPVFLLKGVGDADELRFNQIHNAADIATGGPEMTVPPGRPGDWTRVPGREICGTVTSGGAAKRNEILRLLGRHGEWGSAVATESGRVIVGAQYAAACSILNMSLVVRYVPDDWAPDLLACFGREYGEFSYRNLPKTTWAQSMAQMYRLREGSNKSRTYEHAVIPALKRGERVLDFGAGQMDYVRLLRRRGHSVRGIEFYYRDGNSIDVGQVQPDIDGLCADIAANGLYDTVVCDSVVNSVDSPEAERDVLTCVNALCRPGGRIVFSGRSRAFQDREQELGGSGDRRRRVEFVDRDGMTGIFVHGNWRFQKFHWLPEIYRLARSYVGMATVLSAEGRPVTGDELSTSGWIVAGTKTVEAADPEESLAREFDLPLPDGRRYGRSADIVAAWRSALNCRQPN